MSSNTVPPDGKEFTWEQFPIFEVFMYQKRFFMKINDHYLLQVRKGRNGEWRGYGPEIEYDPSLRITLVPCQKSQLAAQQYPWGWIIVALLIVLFSVILLWLPL